MNEHDTLTARINQLIAKAIQVPVAPDANVERERTPQWDSLKHIEISFLIEEEFGLMLDQEAMKRLQSTKAIASWLRVRHAA